MPAVTKCLSQSLEALSLELGEKPRGAWEVDFFNPPPPRNKTQQLPGYRIGFRA